MVICTCVHLLNLQILTETPQNVVEVQQPVDIWSDGVVRATVELPYTIPSVVVFATGYK